jgi:hypothetical protein
VYPRKLTTLRYLSATALIQQWAAQVASEVAEKDERKAKKEIIGRYNHNAR